MERQLPDSDSTVIVHCPQEDEPTWLGYHDGEEWRAVEGNIIEVTHWMEMPEPPDTEMEVACG